MAYGQNLSDDIGSYVATIYENSTLVARAANFMTSLVTIPPPEAGTAVRSRSEYGTATFNQISDADELTSQTFTPSVQNSVTPAMFGAQFWITDRRRRSSPVESANDAASELGLAAAKHVQTKLVGNFSSFTAGTVGTSGGTVTWGNVGLALTYLQLQNAPPPYYGVLPPMMWYFLGTPALPTGAQQTNAPGWQDQLFSQWYVGRAMGVDWFITPDIAQGSAVYGGIFSRSALIYDERLAYRIEPQRDASKGGGGWELNATLEYAHGVWRPKFGVAVLGTA